MAEAGFLRRRQERLDERSRIQREKALAVTNDYDDTNGIMDDDGGIEWFQEPWEAWKASVAQLPADVPQTENDKRRVRMQIVQLQQELHALRTKVLSSTGTYGHANRNMSPRGSHQDDTLLDQCYKQLTESQSLLDATKKRLLPKGKFVFARYRLAMQQREQQLAKDGESNSLDANHVNDNDAGVTVESTLSKEPGVHHDQLQYYQHSTIRIFPDHIQVAPYSSDETTNDRPQEGSTIHIDRPPVVLSNLHHCLVTYDATAIALSNVHLVDCTQVTVTFSRAAALHVTNCHHVTFQDATIQQVRLHESSWLTCNCSITAGAILEGCHSVVFGHPCAVRDFHWLRGTPSPNFSFAEEPINATSTSTISPTAATTIRSATTTPSATVTINHHDPVDQAPSPRPNESIETEKTANTTSDSTRSGADDTDSDEEL